MASCERCHHTPPNPKGCATCNPERLGERLRAALIDANKLRAALVTVLASASPHPTEHRAMSAAWAAAREALAGAEQRDTSTLHRAIDWHDDDGAVLWWHLSKGKIAEPPYVGYYGDAVAEQGGPDYYTHWSRIPHVVGP
jgi:hypothetical protein